MTELPTQPTMASHPARRGSAFRRVVLWLAVVLLGLLAMLQVGMAWRELAGGGMDIMPDYVAGQRLWTGRDIYSPLSPAEVSALGVHEEYHVGIRLNGHTPFAALVFAPLALLPFSVITLLWTLASVALLFGTLWVLITEFDLPLRGPWLGIALVLPLLWYPVWQHLHAGQLTIFLFALMVGAWRCERRGRPVLAGCLLGIAVMLKIYPLLLIAYVMARRRWCVVGTSLGVMLALVLVQMAVNPAQWPEYLMRVAPATSEIWMPFARNISLASISVRLFVGSNEVQPFAHAPAAELPARIALYFGALGLQVAWLWRTRRQPCLTAEYCLCLSALPLLSPLSWDHGIVFLLMPFAFLWQQYRSGGLRKTGFPLVCAGIAVALSFFPSDIAYAALQRFFAFQQMPALVHFHATGLAVLLLGFTATLAAVWRLPGRPAKPPAEHSASGLALAGEM
jgi:hypothetical protein